MDYTSVFIPVIFDFPINHISFQAIPSPLDDNISSKNYQLCLIPNISEHGQYVLYGFTTLVLLPVDTLLASMSLISNSVILFAVSRTRSIQRPSLLLLCSLSMTDAFWSIYAITENILNFTRTKLCPREATGEVEFFLVVLLYHATLSNLAIISFDRLLAVSKPLWYRSHISRSHAFKQITFLWVLSATISGNFVAGIYFPFLLIIPQIMSALAYFLSFLTIICSYVGILIANIRQRAAMEQYAGHIRAILMRERRVANTVGLILIVLCFTFLPALLAPFLIFHVGKLSEAESRPFRLFHQIFVTLNGLLNPLLNYGRNREVQQAVKAQMGCHCCNGAVHPTNNRRQ